VTDAKARAIGVLVDQAWALFDWNLGGNDDQRLGAINVQCDGLDAIAELLRPRPDPAHFYDYRV
jgi:hypothetical protein